MQPVLRSEELPPGDDDIRSVEVGPVQVLLARLPTGQVVAFGSRCPHQGTPLEEGSLWDGVLRCRKHMYLYDPRTGENLVPARDARPGTLWKLRPGYLPTFPVEERDGWIWVDDSPRPPPAAYHPAAEQPPPPGQEMPEAPQAAAEGGPAPVVHPVRTLDMTVGKPFQLLLPVPGLAGHVWRVEVTDGLLSVLSQQFEAGEKPRHRVRLLCPVPGEATLTCTYSRPGWEDRAKEVRTFVVRAAPPAPGG